MTDDALLRELGKELPYERPDDARREALRASLLAAATRREDVKPQRWRVVAAFGAGAVAAAAIAMIVMGRRAPVQPVASEHARIESSAAAELEHTVAATPTGTDEIVRVRAGKVGVVVAPAKAGERVLVKTGDAEIDGAGTYEVAVIDDKLSAVTVTAGIAKVVVAGHQAVFLAAGQTWHSDIWTADLTPHAKVDPPAVAPTTETPVKTAVAPTVAPTAETPAKAVVTPTIAPRTETPAVATVVASKTETPANPAVVASNTETPAKPAVATTVASKTATPAKPAIATTVAPKTEPPAQPAPTIAPKTETPAVSTGVAPPVESHPAVTAAKPVAPSETEQHFQRGWKLLKDGKAIEAANELGLAADGDGPIAVDARYFQAEALVRAGRKTEAEKALVGFLDHAQQSLRRGRAAVMLARLIAERGDKTAARNWFQSAVNDADPAIAAAARAGLAAL